MANLIIDRSVIPSGEIEIAGVVLMDVARFQRIATSRWQAAGTGMRAALCDEFLKYHNQPKSGRQKIQTIAVQRAKRRGSELESQFHSDVRRALSVLAGTLWVFSPRDPLFSFGTLEQASRAERIWFFQDVAEPVGKRALFAMSKREGIAPRWLNGFWVAAERTHRFLKYANAFFDKASPATPNWRGSMERAFRLFGEGYLEYDAQQAAFANLIALDVLLFEVEEGKKRKLQLLNAVLGWIRMTAGPAWADKAALERLVDIRNTLAHEGYSSNLTVDDLLLSDDIVGNLLLLIVRNPDVFSSKVGVRRFAEQALARETLNIDTLPRFVRRNTPAGHVFRTEDGGRISKRLTGLHDRV